MRTISKTKMLDTYPILYPPIILDLRRGYNDGIKGDGDLSTAKDNYASWLGSTLGEIFGYRDFYNNRRANGTNALPSNKNLIEMFNLNGFTSQYRLEFLRKFKEGFLEGYQEGYRRAKLSNL